VPELFAGRLTVAGAFVKQEIVPTGLVWQGHASARSIVPEPLAERLMAVAACAKEAVRMALVS